MDRFRIALMLAALAMATATACARRSAEDLADGSGSSEAPDPAPSMHAIPKDRFHEELAELEDEAAVALVTDLKIPARARLAWLVEGRLLFPPAADPRDEGQAYCELRFSSSDRPVTLAKGAEIRVHSAKSDCSDSCLTALTLEHQALVSVACASADPDEPATIGDFAMAVHGHLELRSPSEE